MKILLVLSFALFTAPVFAEVSSTEVAMMLEQMVKQGTISAAEAAKAKSKMGGMTADQWRSANAQAETLAAQQTGGARAPASTGGSIKDVGASSGGNLDGAQFQQIKDDVKKIVPKFQEE